MKLENQQFVGTWELQEWTIESGDGHIKFPFGKDSKGIITYENNGSMSVQIMKKHRPQFSSEDPLKGEIDKVVAAYHGFIAYCGSYEVHLNSRQIIHQIKLSSFPNWVGQHQMRYFEFNEDQLTLSTDAIGGNKHKLIWKKLIIN